MKHRKSFTYLPIKIRKIIENSKLPQLQKGLSFKIISLILRNLMEERASLEDSTEIPSSFWKKSISSHYEIPMKMLLDAKVVIRPNSYSTIDNQCMSYRLNPEMLDDNFEGVWYQNENKRKPEDSYVCKKARKFLSECKIDQEAAFRFIYSYTQSDEIEARLLYDEDVNDGWLKAVYSTTWEGEKFKTDTSKTTALQHAKNSNLTLIQDKRKYTIADKETYLSNKRRHIKYSYEKHVLKLLEGDVYANRNDTNRRLDSNLSTMPSVVIHLISLDGEKFVNIDLRNSQFVMLATLIEKGKFNEFIKMAEDKKPLHTVRDTKPLHIVRDKAEGIRSIPTPQTTTKKVVNGSELIETKMIISHQPKEAYMCALDKSDNLRNSLVTKDLWLFLKLAKTGKLYDFVRDELGLEPGETGRKRAKQMMFEIFFSSYKARTKNKTKVKKLFPTLIKMIDLFKKQEGDNQFAIALQKAESSIFINKILTRLYRSGYKVFSKHDSILCKQSDLEAVKGLMMQVLDKEIGANQYQLKVEG